MMRTANPALNAQTFRTVAGNLSASEVMTLDGTVNKTVISTAITMAVAYYTYSNPIALSLVLPFAIVALIIGIVLSFKKQWAPFLTPAYAVTEGGVLGAISFAADMRYPGVAVQAVGLTFGTLLALLFAYKSRLIRPTENFKLGVVAATGGIAVLYLISWIVGMFGVNLSFLHSSSPLSIGISLVVVVIAALNLVLDFDFIEQGAASRSLPKYMEWYGAFGLLVTLVWLYVEMIRLLTKLNERNR